MSETPSPFDDKSSSDNEGEHTQNTEIQPQPITPPHIHNVYRRRSLFWPISLISFGLLLLLSNLGYFPSTGWAVLWRFWPIALIALGIDVMIGRRTTGGAVASAILILLLVGLAIGAALFADQIPVLVDLVKPAVLNFEHVEHPLNGTEQARVTIDWTSAPGQLSALTDSTNLIEADVAYRGNLIFDVSQTNTYATVVLNSYLQGVSYGVFTFDDSDAQWDVRINADVVYELELDVGSGACDFDLSELQLDNVEIDGGSGSLTLTLPADGFLGHIDGGSGSISLLVPDGVGISLEIDRGSGGLFLGDDFVVKSGDIDDNAVWESLNFDESETQIIMQIDQGSGSLNIR